MYLQSFVVRNFRRLRNAKIDLATDATVFVGANNSGKPRPCTSSSTSWPRFPNFSIYDFSAETWQKFNDFDPAVEETELPAITLDLWFRWIKLTCIERSTCCPTFEWQESTPVGIRLSFEAKDPAELYANF